MRKPLILAALLAAAPLTGALAQTSTPPARLELSVEQRAHLTHAVARGRALAVLDQTARVTTQDMLTRVPDAQNAGIEGWIAQPEGNGVTITYYGREGDNYVAIYKSQVLGGRVTSPQVFAAGSRPTLTGPAARMAAARAAAGAIEHQACGPEFNAIVLPPEGDGPVLVYRLSPRMAADKVPGGGHYRVSVALDGTVAEDAPLGGACTDIAIPPVAAGARPAPLRINATGSELPSEIHVFLSASAQRPVVVATGGSPVRLWGVTPEGIAELQQ